MIEIKDLTKKFGEVTALDNLSFKVNDGVAFGFLGRNGAGKTTTIRILLNIFREDSGEALIDGVPAHNSKKRIGYLPEERGLYIKRTVLEQMIYIGMLKGLDKNTAEKASRSGLEEMEATEYTDRKLGTLSKGNQQKIQLAIALLGDPDVVILDEPFSGLDPINSQILKNAVRRCADRGKTVIFSSHQMSQVEELCDDICLIDKGSIKLDGNLTEIKRSYPRDRIFVSVFSEEDKKFEPASLFGSLDFIESWAEMDDGFAVTLLKPQNRGDLYRAFDSRGIVPDSFSVIEPNLEKIFVDTVGDES